MNFSLQKQDLWSSSQEMIERLKRLSEHEEVQKIVNILTDEKVLDVLERLSQTADWKEFFAIQAIFFLAFTVIRSVFGLAFRAFIIKWILYRIFTSLVYWAATVYIIPAILLGESYHRLVSAMIEGIRQQYF